jgi:hypothetical protein
VFEGDMKMIPNLYSYGDVHICERFPLFVQVMCI